jgi:AcrR family transcriptional regulator
VADGVASRARECGRTADLAEQKLTAKGKATRRRIVESAALLIRENGAANTSIDEVLRATSTSKSQLFHYFPAGRTDLLYAVAEHEADYVLASQQPFLGDLTTWRKWQTWRKVVIAHYVELGGRCPLGALTSYLGRTDPMTRVVIGRLYDEWEAHLVIGVQALHAKGPSRAPAPVATARSILAAIQGGVTMLQATDQIDYLECRP